MTAKEYLTQYKNMAQEIQCLDVEIEELWSRLTSTTAGYSDMPHSPNREEKHTKLHSLMADKLQVKEQKKREAEDIMAEVLEAIDTVTDPIYRQLLFERYIQCKEWVTITQDLRYESEEYVRGELHGKALKEVRFMCRDS